MLLTKGRASVFLTLSESITFLVVRADSMLLTLRRDT